MGTRKKLSVIGNSFGLIINRPILEILDIDESTDLDISTDGNKLIIEPVRTDRPITRPRKSEERIKRQK
ncbi:MAG: AbrB/MazE/SpoVT family DNA-binding domain-containing protein [Oligoflexia bacterium]|nr:AbrB/MazE/SpoVT family DNA-binding domain-containing protein [Oligoflexia bacterium]